MYLFSTAAVTNCQKLSRFIISHFCRSEIPVGWAVPLLQASQARVMVSASLGSGGHICCQGHLIVTEFTCLHCRAAVPFLAGWHLRAFPSCLKFLVFLTCVFIFKPAKVRRVLFLFRYVCPPLLPHLFCLHPDKVLCFSWLA